MTGSVTPASFKTLPEVSLRIENAKVGSPPLHTMADVTVTGFGPWTGK